MAKLKTAYAEILAAARAAKKNNGNKPTEKASETAPKAEQLVAQIHQ